MSHFSGEAGLELADWRPALGRLVGIEEVGGILGFDVLIRCVAELDPNRGRLALHDPEGYRLPEGGRWEPLVLHRRHPFVRARFPGAGEGWFCIDSGAGAMPVCFHSGTVRERGLLEGVETEVVAAFADAWSAGTLGHPFFAGLRLVLDYAGGRVGIVPAP